MKLLPGKVPTEILQKIVFKNLGNRRGDVILGPRVGEDAALVKVGEEKLSIATDPVTGAEGWLGWLAVNVSANDVATCGVQPSWFSSNILLPEDSNEKIVKEICGQMNEAASQLDMAIIGGHCEVTPGLSHPIVIGCSVGVADNGRYVTSAGAKPGDKIIMTKGVGIEGTAILASDRRKELLKVFDEKFLDQAQNFFTKISVVKEALIAFRTGGVSAMHDPTEGGVAGGLHELADAAKVDIRIQEKNILISDETTKICDVFDIDPLRLISSGTLLIVTQKRKEGQILTELSRNNIPARVIGEITKSGLGRILVTKKGKKEDLARPPSDHLWIALEKVS
ncbi:hydrogenase [Candidatus Bathyarchaeota archaeon]|nr:hydrogenase [Candidatus Bathyarchaeota archaeon]NIU81438.1 hydrogenase [Candidatus Bathyarchaeota archaeon]NIV68078.1 hydrogenase [Candidatus Bathyarchaeota archaeon]